MTGKSYDDLEIHDGGQASIEFLLVHFGTATDAERQQVRRNLDRYSGLDTEGMIWIVDKLRRLCRDAVKKNETP